MEINYVIVAIDSDGNKLHWCAYETMPGKAEFDSLTEELKTDAEFGLTDTDFILVLGEADDIELCKRIVEEQ